MLNGWICNSNNLQINNWVWKMTFRELLLMNLLLTFPLLHIHHKYKYCELWTLYSRKVLLSICHCSAVIEYQSKIKIVERYLRPVYRFVQYVLKTGLCPITKGIFLNFFSSYLFLRQCIIQPESKPQCSKKQKWGLKPNYWLGHVGFWLGSKNLGNIVLQNVQLRVGRKTANGYGWW